MPACTVNIADSMWTVEVVSPNGSELYIDNVNCNGATWFTPQKIYLSSSVPAHAVKRVIIHELTHAFLYITQMRVPDMFTEEEVCNFFGRWGYEIMILAESIIKQLYFD